MTENSVAASYDAREITNFILDRADRMGVGISNMHINKILYFAHGWFLALRKQRLISQPFEAWEYGPVIQDVYHQFKQFDRRSIQTRAIRLHKMTATYQTVEYRIADTDVGLLGELTDYFMRIPAGELSRRSHKEGGPWYLAWNYAGKSNPGMRIDDAAIYKWFSSLEARESET